MASAASTASIIGSGQRYSLPCSSSSAARRFFMTTSAFNLRYEQKRWPKIAFTDVKDYQKAAA